MGKDFSQVQLVQQWVSQNDIPVDAIYSSHQKKNQCDIWEDYKQIYLDFSITSDHKVKEKVLFISSFDADFNARQEEVKCDPQGYFLIDANSKPARPLAQGLPLTYETGEKEIDLADKGGMFQFNPRKEI